MTFKVDNLPKGIKTYKLRKILKEYGLIRELEIVRSLKFRNANCAYVRLRRKSYEEYAVSGLNYTYLDGDYIYAEADVHWRFHTMPDLDLESDIDLESLRARLGLNSVSQPEPYLPPSVPSIEPIAPESIAPQIPMPHFPPPMIVCEPQQKTTSGGLTVKILIGIGAIILVSLLVGIPVQIIISVPVVGIGTILFIVNMGNS